MTTAVYFDLDGTLCTYDRSFEEQFATTVSPYGEPTDAAYDAYVDRLFGALESCESEPYRRAFEAVAETAELDVAPVTLASDHCETELEALVVSANATRVLERVAETNPIGILTNGDGSQQRAKLERHGLGELVEEVLVSNDVGAGKPDPEIFDLAKERLPADEHVYVGDSYDEDIVGARSAGFRTIYVVENETGANDTDAADAVVSAVGELLDPTGLPSQIATPFEPAER
ncbi:HAD family hydrolase [Natronococcus pandeyae]|uniref:HAD family hydrolase n=1 Tax=Natronococcus pandeyae TaxID=2055836 RepID=UPI001F2CAF2A|nr:HAD family hydrolase [Natronococcus pandeyae]